MGFLLASLLITMVVHDASFDNYNSAVRPGLVLPITSLPVWASTLYFVSIGLMTRLRDLAPAGGRPPAAFGADVVINLVIGFILSDYVFGDYWAHLPH